ncbi:hypothetical protein T310_2517 [Rasamsonia emersonii CBS 393.64]|uniref:Transcriptional regulatory protein RXT2 N-terminal domain-containing protein n=1 Tax=Rasamsonia emersonii (strain ATCC 16479 / CBS 393.64 / IMI 116815) TaxID=1408163 RepID=A0A0F4Z029_RASE3|nr:hypothetical protein T310_2517 [Rasamsonia emersonii CBS 393.64]KKA23451.1 hypothetical protein T310_2517 [Rasamsonia emersonii CBS 393.64]
MTTQAALIADTIIGLKKALRRENDHSGPDEPITQPTNRGNKLRANAKYVHEGVLGYTNPQELYKEKIEHAGYTRYILRRNPPRYDSEGDELEEDDEDSEADAAAAEENPFSEVAIEQILCPLKHPSELPNHPAMSQPYKSKALRTMTQAIEEKLRKERALLWRARNLHRQFLGDAVWMPCGKVETPEDRFIFEPRPTNEGSGLGINGLTQSEQVLPSGDSASKNTKAAVHEMVQGGASRKNSIAPQTEDQGHPSSGGDIEMTDAPNPETELSQDTKKPKTEDDDAVVADLPQHTESGDSEMKSNGAGLSDTKTNKLQPVGGLRGEVEAPDGNGEVSQEEPSDATVDVEMRNTEQPDEGQDTEETPDGSSPEPLRRMTTRAQANASTTTEENGVANQRPSPAETMDKIPSAHPIFLVPDNIRPDRDFGLPRTKQKKQGACFGHSYKSRTKLCEGSSTCWSRCSEHVG